MIQISSITWIRISCLLLLAPFANAEESSGTGFFVSKEGLVATAAHVLKGDRFEILHEGKRHPATIVAVDFKNDVAILRAETASPKSWLAPCETWNVKLGEEVFTMGFPLSPLQGQAVKFTRGEISSLKGVVDDPRSFQISAPIQPGKSGGPLVDAGGRVLGIITAALDPNIVLEATGNLPQNVNYAIRADYLILLMKSAGVFSGRQASWFRRLGGVRGYAEKAVVQVEAYKVENDQPSINLTGQAYKLANDFMLFATLNRPTDYASLFATQCAFYGEGLVGRDLVAKRRSNWIRMWPDREYWFAEEPKFGNGEGGRPALIELPAWFLLKSPKEARFGKVNYRLGLSYESGVPRICSLEQEVLSINDSKPVSGMEVCFAEDVSTAGSQKVQLPEVSDARACLDLAKTKNMNDLNQAFSQLKGLPLQEYLILVDDPSISKDMELAGRVLLAHFENKIRNLEAFQNNK